uniref:Palmitoyl-protein thioesterase ABHD10, mitochondrial n=1 Tax=Caligus clemensi TaxID=344056 RepID=C1C278_CALCM|nr:Abhydrolase domain-containing protein 10, mitochondrial precursor [Caligus clemensi]
MLFQRFVCSGNAFASTYLKRMKSSITSQYLELKSGRRIFVDYIAGVGDRTNPCVVYVPGFLSHRLSEKGQRLLDYCSKAGHEFVRYDPEGFGKSEFSSPEKWKNIEFRHWFEDCEAAMGMSPNKKFILVGSSMGGWISLLIQQKYAERIAGMVLIAPAQNFISRMVAEGNTMIRDPLITQFVDIQSFAEKSKELSVSLQPDSNEINIPVRIVHGMKDDVIPSGSSLELIRSIRGDDIELTLIKTGDHQLHHWMSMITGHIEALIKRK